jgi:hypothetical protein
MSNDDHWDAPTSPTAAPARTRQVKVSKPTRRAQPVRRAQPKARATQEAAQPEIQVYEQRQEPVQAAAPRGHVSRAQEARSGSLRRGVGGEYRGRLWIDPALLDPNKAYCWVREECLGETDKGNIQQALDVDGYSPSSGKQNPMLLGRSLPGWQTNDDLVRRGGLILMERPKQWALEDQQRAAAETQEALRSVTRELEETRGRGDPKYLQRPSGEQVRVETVRGDTGLNQHQRFTDA